MNTLFKCLDLTHHITSDSGPSAAAISYLKTGGVTSPLMPGKSAISAYAPGEVDQATFLREYWNWGYYAEGENLFVDRLAATASDCFDWGLPGVAVNTIDWHMDYHVLTCADQSLLDLAEEGSSDACERFKLDPLPPKSMVPGDFGAAKPGYSDKDIAARTTGGLLSRGIWYNDEGIAVYRLCDLLPNRMPLGQCLGSGHVVDHALSSVAEVVDRVKDSLRGDNGYGGDSKGYRDGYSDHQITPYDEFLSLMNAVMTNDDEGPGVDLSPLFKEINSDRAKAFLNAMIGTGVESLLELVPGVGDENEDGY